MKTCGLVLFVVEILSGSSIEIVSHFLFRQEMSCKGSCEMFAVYAVTFPIQAREVF